MSLSTCLRRLVFITMFLFALSGAILWKKQAWAQENPKWAPAINISNTAGASLAPSIVADPAGGVHVVWHELSGGSEQLSAIYYTDWDGNAWSRPTDLAFGQIGSPVLEADQSGSLYLAWIDRGQGRIRLSQALANAAHSAQGWHAVGVLVPFAGQVQGFDMMAGPNGRVHLLWVARKGEEKTLYYSASNVEKSSWDEAVSIMGTAQSDRLIGSPSLAIAPSGAIHVVWTEYNFPETFPPRGIGYTHSLDGGRTWSAPIVREGPYEHPEVLAAARDEVHLVWSGTNPDRFKFHSWSSDRGEHWTPPKHTAEAGGFQGRTPLVSDGLGVIHLLQSYGSGIEVLVHRAFDDGEWKEESILMETPADLPRESVGTGASPEDPDVTIALGNQLHVVAKQYVEVAPGTWDYDIFHVQGKSGAPALPPQALATPEPVPAVQAATSSAATPPTQVEVADTPSMVPAGEDTPAPSQPRSTASLLSIALLPAAGFLVVVLARRLIQSH